MTANRNEIAVLKRLYEVIASRRGKDAGTSYTAKLFMAGRGHIADKVSEEAGETIDAALNETPARVVSESADLLYHLLVLWADTGVSPEDVWAELERREGISGIEEKNARRKK
ncbi:MAG: phosphoribosyl-ATP diphosphatase [Rhodospirillales bacterium]|nr:phosphoribosyl-ATP diphosphatase [Rhodospirillales bacterium]